jgi:DNA primase
MREVADEIAKSHLRLVKIKDDFIAAACPFHKGGQERRPSFWISRTSGDWGCFACAEHGPDLKALLHALGVKKSSLENVIDEAVKEARREQNIKKAERRRKARAEFRGMHILPEALLGVYEYCPVKLLDEGFDEETLKAHDIGFDRDRQRITFPLRDVFGNLVGISGRTVEPGAYPKYKIYEGWHETDGIRSPGELGEWFPEYSVDGIRDHLWRSHFFYRDIFDDKSKRLIIVEGYKAAMWLVQFSRQRPEWGWWFNTGALMGARMSSAQERLVRRMGTETWIFLDNNDAGRTGTEAIGDRLGNSTFPVYLCRYPEEYDDDVQPSDLSGEEIESILGSAVRAKGRFKWQSPSGAISGHKQRG